MSTTQRPFSLPFPFSLFFSPSALAQINPFLAHYYAPLSGDVTQDINPVTSWLSPHLQFNFAGNKDIESDVTANIASYGRQLGTIIPAVLELAGDKDSPAIENLRAMAAHIEEVKEKHRQRSQKQLREQLAALQKEDPEALKALLASFQ